MLAIKKLREKSGLSQIELAKLLNVTQGAVSQWESKKSYPRAEVLIKIAALFNCTLDELLRDDDAPVPPTAAAV